MHESSYNLAKSLVEKYYTGGSVLDVGSAIVDGQPTSYKDFFDPKEYRGADLSGELNVDVIIPPINWGDCIHANFIISGQVLEHTQYPWIFFEDIHNALSFEGIAIVIAPSSGDYHAYPKDCYRFFPDGLEAMATHAELKVLEKGKVDAVPWNDSFIVVQKC